MTALVVDLASAPCVERTSLFQTTDIFAKCRSAICPAIRHTLRCMSDQGSAATQASAAGSGEAGMHHERAAGSGAAAVALLSARRDGGAKWSTPAADDSDALPATFRDNSDLDAADAAIGGIRTWRVDHEASLAKERERLEASLAGTTSALELPKLPEAAAVRPEGLPPSFRTRLGESGSPAPNVEESQTRLAAHRQCAKAGHAPGAASADPANSEESRAATLRDEAVAIRARALAAERLAALGIDLADLAGDDDDDDDDDGDDDDSEGDGAAGAV